MAIIDHSPAFRRLLPHAGFARWLRLLPLAAVHAAALVTLWLTEYGAFGQVVFLLTWGFLNFFWIMILRRPALAGLLSLAIVEGLIVLSLFKFDILEMTVSFFDFLIVDADSITFLATVFPDLRSSLIVVAIFTVPLVLLVWRLDPFRVRFLAAAAGALACLAAMAALTSAVPEQPWEPYQGINHISNFARSGVLSVSELMTHGWLESDAVAAERLPVASGACRPAAKPPHIIMVLDESSFDVTAVPNVKVPPGYDRHFLSVDGRKRKFIAEATGGPTVYSEYNVLTGLSARSYGRFMFNVTRIAAGNVLRGLPHALARCGYQTTTVFPALGAFLSARRFQHGAGIERFVDLHDMGTTTDLHPDSFFYGQALQAIESGHKGQPQFVFVYVAANHFPWTHAFRPELTPDWKGYGNDPEVDEYIRRQSMSAHNYAEFRDRLHQAYPDESFLIVRFGDHQPALSARLLDPAADQETLARRIAAYDPKYFATYYAIDAINFDRVNLASALDSIEAPNLPLVMLESAGLPLDPSFAEQKKIFERCKGLFYSCANGAEARRFNRLLIDAGLIKNL
jgi:Sulfatase